MNKKCSAVVISLKEVPVQEQDVKILVIHGEVFVRYATRNPAKMNHMFLVYMRKKKHLASDAVMFTKKVPL